MAAVDAPGPSSPPPEWEAIIRQHDRRVVLALMAMGLRLDRAKELAQTTWLRLFEQHQAGKLERLEFPGLALRQARFLALDALRRERLATEHDATELEAVSLDGSKRKKVRLKVEPNKILRYRFQL
jgi:DNA-directed RNA polymerase specialized sigma24 family protein